MTAAATVVGHDDALRVDGLGYDYGGYRAVRDVTLTVRTGELFALLGTNGAGKTTTLDMLQGFRRPSEGSVRAFGVDPVDGSASLRRRTRSVLQQAGFVPELTVRETVRMCAALSSRTDDEQACLDRVGLADRATVPVADLSGGERRRLDIACATWGVPDLLIMDEPTTGLDPASRRTLWEIVETCRDKGTTIVLTTHYLEEVESLADRVAIMHAGSIAVSGTVPEVLATRPSLITAELDAGVAPPRVPGLTTSAVPGDPARTALRIECTDLQGEAHRLTGWAADNDVRLGRLRATSASLEDVFHAVRDDEGER